MPSNKQKIYGYLYLIQLEPEYHPKRFKIGFTTRDPEARLKEHRVAAPLAELVGVWRCKKKWEYTAIDSISQGCESMSREIFVATESYKPMARILRRCDKFIKAMPDISQEMPDGYREIPEKQTPYLHVVNE